MYLLMLSFIKDRRVWLTIVGVLGLYVAYTAHTNAIFEKGRLTGILYQTELNDAEKLSIQKTHDEEIRRLNKLKLDTESALTDKLAAIEQQLEDKIKEVNKNAETTIANLRNRNVRLSIELRNTAADAATTELAAAASCSYGKGRAELSDNAAGFLIGLASRADRVAVTLESCQNTIKQYRLAVDEYNKKYTNYSF